MLCRSVEHFQEKWKPVFRPKMRPEKELHFHFQEKHAPGWNGGWGPVFRPKMRPGERTAFSREAWPGLDPGWKSAIALCGLSDHR
jgi:hypothetical protein